MLGGLLVERVRAGASRRRGEPSPERDDEPGSQAVRCRRPPRTRAPRRRTVPSGGPSMARRASSRPRSPWRSSPDAAVRDAARVTQPTVDVRERLRRRERPLQHLAELERRADRGPRPASGSGCGRARRGDPLVDPGEPRVRICVEQLVARRASSRGRRRATQSATSTPATQMAPKAATTTAVVIPLSFPCVAPYAGERLLVYGVRRTSRFSSCREGARRPLHSTSAGGGVQSLPRAVCHDYRPER